MIDGCIYLFFIFLFFLFFRITAIYLHEELIHTFPYALYVWHGNWPPTCARVRVRVSVCVVFSMPLFTMLSLGLVLDDIFSARLGLPVQPGSRSPQSGRKNTNRCMFFLFFYQRERERERENIVSLY